MLDSKPLVGLVMEGGAMRGMYTAGVIDVLLENKILLDGAIGVSAGAAFGCNYKSQQIGRIIRYNKRFCNDARYVSWKSWWNTGDLYNADFAYDAIPNVLDPFDFATFANSPMEFYVVTTEVNTGEAVYHKCVDASPENIQWMRASASMPLVSNVIQIGDYALSDGGTADSIPLKYFESLGYSKNIVVLTQPASYVKTKNPIMPIIRVVLRKYPKLIEALANRHDVYNEQVAYVTKQEKAGAAFVLRPPAPLGIGAVEHDARQLERGYQMGRREALDRLPEMREFLSR